MFSAQSVSKERVEQKTKIDIFENDFRKLKEATGHAARLSEELDRLRAHVTSARELLKQGSPVGRKLDFLSQEFNREANTLCSKSSDSSLTQIGLDLKNVIDQFREQIQNVE